MSQKIEPSHQTGFFSDDKDSLFKAVFDTIQTGIIIIDPDTHLIVEANTIAQEILGLSKNEMINRMCHESICPAKEGTCPVTDQNTTIANEERIFLNKKGDKVAVLKTVAKAKINKSDCLQ